MLSDRVKRLLTTAVDGELDQLERRALQKVLQQSEEARTLYQQLKRDSGVIRNLPRQGLPPHFSCNVLQAVGATARAPPGRFEPPPNRLAGPLGAMSPPPPGGRGASCAAPSWGMGRGGRKRAAAPPPEKKKKLAPELIAAPKPYVPTPPAVAKNT